jgi:acylphosphatase
LNSTQTCLHAFVEGYVQGVGFRFYVLHHARPLGLTGWVRNTHQDEVEVMAEGNHSALEDLLGYLASGPEEANVTHIRQEWLEASGKYSGFDVYPSI